MKPALRVAGVVFALVALAHLLRVVFNLKVAIGNFSLPMGISVAGAIIALLWPPGC